MPDSPSVEDPKAKGAAVASDAKTPGSQAAEDAAEPAQADQAEAATEDGPVTSSAKEIFAAALEKKKSAGQSRSAHLDGHGGVGGATASHKATRTFRRKSG